MESKTNQFYRQKQIVVKSKSPCLSLQGYDLIKSHFNAFDKVIVTYETNKITIQKAISKKTAVVIREFKNENPELKTLLDRLELVLISES